uniref:Methylglutaconyl-CoA hydratase, mitochondrial n=1 Tax=Steinernema glaseri TaxID=37863 RepID=A0A1I8AFJ7_9BILA
MFNTRAALSFARLPIRGFLNSGSTLCYSTQAAPLTIDKLKDECKGIVVIRLHKPETRNAISKAMLQHLRSSLDDIKFDKDARVLIFKSDVPGAFCSGADLKERRLMPAEDVPKFVDQIRGLVNDVANLPIPVIAAIDGFALGGGLELALACDIRVSTAAAKMGLTETRLAIIPGAGGTQRLSRAIGVALAKEMIFTGRIINGEEALRIGLVSHTVNSETSFPKALEIAKEIIPRGPIAVKLAKIAIDKGSEMDINNGLIVEQQCTAQVVPTKDRLEGLAAFAEKRPPVYKGE